MATGDATPEDRLLAAQRMRAEGHTYREIGVRLGVSMTAARMWLKPEDAQRARQSNREYHAENREQIAQRKREYRKSNPGMAVARNQRRREKYAADPGAARDYDHRYRASVRDQVFAHYGQSCACCGTAADLTIDHVNGDGREHRAEVFGLRGGGGYEIHLWLIGNGFPDGFQALCRPCNASKRRGKGCKLSHGDSSPIVAVPVPDRRVIAAGDGIERWLPVRSYEGRYMVSSRGNVLSLPRVTRTGLRGGGPLKPVLNNGYFGVSLCRDGRVERRNVHVLVLEAFDPPRPNGFEALHGAGGSLDNRWPENLRWGTPAENAADKLRDDTHQRGERQGQHRLTADRVLEIRARNAAGESQRVLAEEFGVSRATIAGCVKRRTWAWL